MGETRNSLTTCRFCERSGFVWYLTKANRWTLAEPRSDLTPDPHKVHFCPVLRERKSRRAVYRKSYKPSTWRRGKSPGSYG